MTSSHYQTDRQAREALIRQIGIGHVVARFIVDKGHPNGPEIHCITDTALIIVFNARTKKMITKLIARPNQLKRYNWTPSRKLLDLAREHQREGWNRI